ncbi:ribonuclease HII, partial [Metamycoplasma equirhinis]
MKNLDFENSINDYKSLIIAGTDEAGRGCCAGPLFVAAVILPKEYQNNEINDSKLLSENSRNKLYDEIIKNALTYSIVEISAAEVDKYNPKQASIIGMKL